MIEERMIEVKNRSVVDYIGLRYREGEKGENAEDFFF